jgi:hypothetical protein
VHCPALVLVPSEDCFGAVARLRDVLAPFRDREPAGAGDPRQARYDWYDIGGRFFDLFRGEVCWPVRGLPKNIPVRVRHVVEPNGEWHDVDVQSCWPVTSPAEEQSVGRKSRTAWAAEVTEVLSAYPDHQAVLVDLHH